MTCKKCSDTGRLPFIRPDGTISNSAVVYCECYRESRQVQPLRPEDFDFPCSDDWRGYYHEEYSGQDPATVTANVERVREVIIERQPANLQHVAGELRYLRQKLTELRAEKKSKQDKPTSKYT